MSEKRFTLNLMKKPSEIEMDGKMISKYDVVRLLNEQSERIKSLEMELDLIANTKLFSRRELERKVDEQQATIDHLKRELEEYKENWDDMVELATKTSRRNVELDEEIGQLQRENEMLKKEIERLNGLLFGTPKEAIE